VFFGTPHRGSQALSQKRLGLLMNIAQLTFTEIPPNIIRALELRSRDLFTINDRFRNIGLVEDKLLSIISFYERRETAVLYDVVCISFNSQTNSLMHARLWTRTLLP
jgi:hypothetical protein